MTLDLNNNLNFNRKLINQVADFITANTNDGKRQGLLTNGWQSKGNFFETQNPIVKPLEKLVFSMISEYRSRFQNSNEGFLKNWPPSYSLFGWFISIRSGGSLASHMHENGWLSGSIYFNIPKQKNKDEGNLVVSQNSDTLPDIKRAFPEQVISLKTGLGCLFPASLFHYTIPFESNQDRIVFAFDVVPSDYKIM
jgi:hypothetical protein